MSALPEMTCTEDVDAGVLDLQVLQLRRESREVLSVLLADPDGCVLPVWEPGAHVDLVLGDVLRQYSLCGDPGDPMTYRVAVLRESRSSGGSRYVHDLLRPGDMVEVGGPRNNFRLGADHDRYVFVAGGIGITPLLPMIAQVDRAGQPWHLHYGGRSRVSMAFLDELSRYRNRVSLVFEDLDGRPDLDALLTDQPPGTGIYACGPEGLVQAIEQRCASWPPGMLHVERFRPRPVSGGLADAPFTVECARSGIEVVVPAGESILDAVQMGGVRLPNACREGICGSCATRVLSGAVEHRDSVLSAAEQLAGDRLMTCVSRAAGPRLVLDL